MKPDYDDYTVRLDKGGLPWMLITSLRGRTLECLRFDGSEFGLAGSIGIVNAVRGDLRIYHHFKASIIAYGSLLDFCVSRLTRYPYVWIRLKALARDFGIYLFTNKGFPKAQEMIVLRTFVESFLRDNVTGYDPIELMTRLYSEKWIHHPKRAIQRHVIDLYLQSLVSKGDLSFSYGRYSLTSQSLDTIDKYDEQQREKKLVNRQQYVIIVLTVVLVLLTMAQVGLFKLPLWFDLSQ